jgi:hypothetical protein
LYLGAPNDAVGTAPNLAFHSPTPYTIGAPYVPGTDPKTGMATGILGSVTGFLQSGFNTLSDAVDVAYQRAKTLVPGTYSETDPTGTYTPAELGTAQTQTQTQPAAPSQDWASTGTTSPQAPLPVTQNADGSFTDPNPPQPGVSAGIQF